MRNPVRFLCGVLCTLLLTACAVPVSMDTAPTPTPVEYPRFDGPQTPVGAAYQLSLVANDTEAFLNGNSVFLAAPPVIQDGIFYLPLEAIVALLGGTYTFDGEEARICLFGVTTGYRVSSRDVVIDGRTYRVEGWRRRFAKDTVEATEIDDAFVPVLRDDIFYLPVNFETTAFPEHGILAAQEYPEEKMVILGGSGIPFGTEEITLLADFDTLPASVRDSLSHTGTATRTERYQIDRYTASDGGLEVYVLTETDGEGTVNSAVCGIKLTRPQYATNRGLHVGDSAYRALRLYGRDNYYTYRFSYRVSEGVVVSIVFDTNYYTIIP